MSMFTLQNPSQGFLWAGFGLVAALTGVFGANIAPRVAVQAFSGTAEVAASPAGVPALAPGSVAT